MTRKFPWAVLAAAFLVSAGAGATVSVASEPALADWTIERFERTIELQPGSGIALVNPLGDIHLRTGDEGRVVVRAVAQRHAKDPRRETLDSETASGRLNLAVRFAGAETEDRPEWGRRRIDLAVEVPARASLSVETGGGAIEAKGHAGALTVKSESGEIRLWVSGPIVARSERGRIQAMLKTEHWRHAANLSTSTSDIEIHFPPRADVDVRLETRGTLTTDVSLEVEHPTPLLKVARARLGGGGEVVELRSDRGNLRIALQLGSPVSEKHSKGEAP